MKFSMRDKYKKFYKNKNGERRQSYLYDKFNQMKQRCYNPKNKGYKNYGERGIKVENYLLIFENYVDEVIRLLPKGETINSMQKKKWSIDRYPNNDGNYERNNLRWAPPEKQGRNQRMKKNNTSGFQGVYLHKRSKKWVAQIRSKRGMIYLGYFNTKQEAFIVYCEAYLEYWGQEDYSHMISLHPHWDDQLKQERSNYETVK